MKPLFVILLFLLITPLAASAPPLASHDKTQITEITLERTPCFGTCPVYSVTLRRDGTATYVGKNYVERMGTYKGTVRQFDRLAELLISRGYFGLKDKYAVNWTDMATVKTSVVMNGKRKTISNYGDAGPVELWGIEMAIDAVADQIKWEKDMR